MKIGSFGGRFGFFVEGNKGVFGGGEVIIGSKRGSSTLKASDFKGASNKTGKAKSGIFRGVFLEIRRFVSFVNNDKPEVFNR